MKQGIHPEYHEINVTMTDGKTVKMYSSVKKDLVCPPIILIILHGRVNARMQVTKGNAPRNSRINLRALISNCFMSEWGRAWIC